MKKIFSYLILIVFVLVTIISCEKQIDYGPDIASIKNDISALKSSIKILTDQLTSIETSLKAKIDLSNSKIDFINANLNELSSKTLAGLSNDILSVNESIKNVNLESSKKLDSLKANILKIEASANSSNQSFTSLNDSYNKLLINYVEILKIIKSTLSVAEINGSVFKGSFLRGSLLFLYELDTNLNQTGRSFNTTIDDDYGNFDLKAQNLNGKLVRVVADGFYWNEVLNENSSTRISLTGICKIDSNEIVNVNVLTHLERARVEYLYNIKKLTFDNAKSQAVKEVLKAFGFENTGIKRAEKVGVVGVGDDSKILLAISTLMQGFRTESEVTQIMNDFANDIKKDGTLDDINIGNDLETHLYYSDTSAVLNNFKIKYRKLYNADTVNTMNMSFIKKFQNATNYSKDKDLFEFPEFDKTGNYKNILSPSNTVYTTDQFGVTTNITRKGLQLKVEILNLDESSVGCTFGFPQGMETGWTIAQPNCYLPTFTSTGQGLQNAWIYFGSKKSYRVNIYERGFVNPTRFKIITYQ